LHLRQPLLRLCFVNSHMQSPHALAGTRLPGSVVRPPVLVLARPLGLAEVVRPGILELNQNYKTFPKNSHALPRMGQDLSPEIH
jgi:hypothetical protein